MMVNFRPIQMFVLEELREFLLLEHRKHFEQSHSVLIENLKSEQWIGGNEWKPNYLCFDDFGFVAEISRFVDDLAKWDHAIDEIRSQYFYEKITNELPEKYLFVFGFNSPVVEELEYLRSRCKTIVKGIEAITTEESKTPSKTEDWREHDLNYVMTLFDKSKNTIPRWADDKKRPFIRRSNREGYYLLNYSDPFIIGQEQRSSTI
jgi:hypothetical protein